MGNNAAFTAFESAVLSTYNRGVLDKALLKDLAEPYRDCDIDSGGMVGTVSKRDKRLRHSQNSLPTTTSGHRSRGRRMKTGRKPGGPCSARPPNSDGDEITQQLESGGGMKKIVDRFANLEVSRQQKWHWRQKAKGKCSLCNEPLTTACYCTKHATYMRNWARNKTRSLAQIKPEKK